MKHSSVCHAMNTHCLVKHHAAWPPVLCSFFQGQSSFLPVLWPFASALLSLLLVPESFPAVPWCFQPIPSSFPPAPYLLIPNQCFSPETKKNEFEHFI